LALGVGIVVDNSIVMLENIAKGAETRHRAAQASANGNGNGNGRNRDELETAAMIDQAAASSQELESALLASTATNLVAVLPFLLIGGFISLLFNELI
jgi:multidrug efflux pump subunit AcrB